MTWKCQTWVRSVTRRSLLRRACGLLGCCRCFRRSAENEEILMMEGLSGETDTGSLSLQCRPIKHAGWQRDRRLLPIDHLSLSQPIDDIKRGQKTWRMLSSETRTVLVRKFTRAVFGLVQGSNDKTCHVTCLTWSHKECESVVFSQNTYNRAFLLDPALLRTDPTTSLHTPTHSAPDVILEVQPHSQ